MTVETNIGNPLMTYFYIDTSGVSHWIGYIDFYMAEFCSDTFEGDLEIIAIDEEELSDTAVFGPLTIVGKIKFSAYQVYSLWPGAGTPLPFFLDAPECFCLGGFKFTFSGDSNPDICNINPYDPIFTLDIMLKICEEYPDGFTFPISFLDSEDIYESMNLNNLSDTLGYAVWYTHGCDSSQSGLTNLYLDLPACSLKYADDFSRAGDLNLNGFRFEAGDMLVGLNAAMDCQPLNQFQFLLGDIGYPGDGLPLTIGDLLIFKSTINWYSWPSVSMNPESDTLVIQSAFADPGEEIHLPVHLVTADTIFGLQFCFVSDTQYVTIDSMILNGDISLTQTSCTDTLHVLDFSFDEPCDSDIVYPGTYYLGDLVAHVKPDVVSDVTTFIEFYSDLHYGIYNTLLYSGLANPGFFQPVFVSSRIHIPRDSIYYYPGDVNMFNGIWPPQVMGSDATYLVNFFRGNQASQPCLIDGFWPSADINGDCSIIGSDVIALVNYFKGSGSIKYCPDYKLYKFNPDSLPENPPSGWPNCETE
ncbi:MAG: hypothetical protein J7K40_02155 [candidate division Zixibacteria bacterium]|nr:hypothetical protein [candidate division Zixibacteria bacterium]